MSEWIKVSDKLPEKPTKGFDEYIIACWSYEMKIHHVGAVCWDGENFTDYSGDIIYLDDGCWSITHWQSMPEPPE